MITVLALAGELDISRLTMQRAPKENLGLKSYGQPRCHNIPSGAEMGPSERTKKLLNTIKHQDSGKVVIWSDEKYFAFAQCTH